MKVEIRTIGIEFTFDAEFKGTEKTNFYRELYGWKNSSNYARYLYIKEGVLSSMNYLKPTRSTIIVSVKDAKQVRKFFKEKKVVFNEKIVILNKAEAKELGLKFDNNLNRVYEELKGNENLSFSVDF